MSIPLPLFHSIGKVAVYKRPELEMISCLLRIFFLLLAISLVSLSISLLSLSICHLKYFVLTSSLI